MTDTQTTTATTEQEQANEKEIETTNDGNESNQEPSDANQGGVKEDPKPRSQKRIEQLIEKNKQIEQEKQELLARIKGYEQIKRPDAEKYDDDDEYEIDKTAYIQQKASEKQEKARLQALEQKSQQELRVVYQSTSQDFYQKIEKSPEETKAFIRSNAPKHKPRPPEIEIDIMDSDYSTEIFEVILKDVDKYNSLSDKDFIKAVAKMEAKFESGNKPLKVPISIANPPKSLSSSGASASSASTNPEWGKLSFRELYKMNK